VRHVIRSTEPLAMWENVVTCSEVSTSCHLRTSFESAGVATERARCSERTEANREDRDASAARAPLSSCQRSGARGRLVRRSGHPHGGETLRRGSPGGGDLERESRAREFRRLPVGAVPGSRIASPEERQAARERRSVSFASDFGEKAAAPGLTESDRSPYRLGGAGVPLSSPSTLRSSSTSGQWIPSPLPSSSQCLLCSGVASRRRGNHARGTESTRPSARLTTSSSSVQETSWARGLTPASEKAMSAEAYRRERGGNRIPAARPLPARRP